MVKKQYLRRTAALALALVFLLALAPSGALAVNEGGSGGLNLNGVTENKTYQCGGGTAVWTYSADTATTPHKLALSGNGTIVAASGAGIELPANTATEITVQGTWSITGGEGKSGIYCNGTLALKLENGATLITAGGSSAGDGLDEHGVSANDLTIDVAAGCNLRAVAGEGVKDVGAEFSGYGIYGASKSSPLNISNNGTIEAVSEGIKPQYGIACSGGVILSGAGTTAAIGGEGINVQKSSASGTGIQINSGTLLAMGKRAGICLKGTNGTTDITIADGVKGLAAGSVLGIDGSGTVTNNSNGFQAADGVSFFTDGVPFSTAPQVDGTAYGNGLDLSAVNQNTLYTDVGGGTALWLPGGGEYTNPHKLLLSGIQIAANGLALPAGYAEAALSHDNDIKGGVRLTESGDNSLTLSGPGALTVAIDGSAPLTGAKYVYLSAPGTGSYATVRAGTLSDGSDARGIPETALTEENGGYYYPADGDRYFELKYGKTAELGDKLLLTVSRGFGGGMYSTGNTVAISFDAPPSGSGVTFKRWVLESGTGSFGSSTSPETTFTMDSSHAVVCAEIDEGGGPPPAPVTYTVTYKANYQGPGDMRDYGRVPGTTVTVRSGDAFPAPEGAVFSGWAETPDGPVKYRAGETFHMPSRNVTLYAVWVSRGPELNRTDHLAYLKGYPDGSVHPGGNLTREEAAALFYRLLTPESRAQYDTEDCPFPDVESTRWSRPAIAALANAGLVKGYPDGTFRPAGSITRAEFAAITARFDSEPLPDGEDRFPDIKNHWAREEINRAAARGWVEGYPDGTFRPDTPITRAEATALINRVLGRLPETPEDLLPGMKTFPDNLDTTAWYYLPLQEAANGHTYERKQDGVHESWTQLLP